MTGPTPIHAAGGSIVWLRRATTALTLAGVGAAAALAAAADADAAIVIAVLAFVAMTGATGVVLTSRLPGHPIGWLLQATALTYATGSALVVYVEVASTVQRALPVAPALVWAGDITFGIGTAICSTWLPLLFPTGRLPSRRWRGVAWLAGISPVALVAGVVLGSEAFSGTSMVNPVALDPDGAVLLALEGGGFYLFAGTVIASVASLVVRYRRARGVERQQLKWVALSATIVGGIVAATTTIELVNGPAHLSDEVENSAITLGLALLPLSIGVAVLRHRLFEIDRLISRTVSYALLSALLLCLYAAIAVLPTLLLDVRSDLLVAAGTLAAAAAFGPLRGGIQSAVDRRFDRARYDVDQVASRFAGRLRRHIDLDVLTDDLYGAVAGTVQPAHLFLWLRTQDAVRRRPGAAAADHAPASGQRAATMARR